MRIFAVVALLGCAGAAPALAVAVPTPPVPAHKQAPTVLNTAEKTAYRAIFAALDARRWADAQAQLAAMPAGLLHQTALAELYTRAGTPRVALEPLLAWLTQSPDLPKAGQIAALAAKRGATDLPVIPTEQRLQWLGSAPLRGRAATIKVDPVGVALSAQVLPLIKADDPAGAEALVETAAGLTPEAQTEWRQRVAWSYYLTGNDADARRVAAKAQAGIGEWAVHADWIAGLAAWRQQDYAAAARAFDSVGRRGEDEEMKAAGQYWAARADMAEGRPELVQGRLRTAARSPETFYGLLAQQALGITAKPGQQPELLAADWDRLSAHTNVRIAAALVEIGQTELAADALRHQAKIGDGREHEMLTRLAGRMNMPALQIWLAHNGPAGTRLAASARYPAPDWTPAGGWRVDRALIFAHTLQESRFRTDAVSPAGAYGLMQLMPTTAQLIARRKGETVDRAALTNPATNIEFGQAYLEQLRDGSATGGLLPKVIAAYNCGPLPVGEWNGRGFDKGDPLLYIESIPYWETRGYVAVVMRNYWMYQQNAGDPSPSRKALAEGLWPRFPGLPGASAVRISAGPTETALLSAQ
ncbi:lytic transglycosylase domain-containing protein [Sphingomonas flavalba]|uniref:lytic transglycosylase domain-containing protein n=1 Tax=Sphingomonas flavalba TaxID=2559804 RepID=UPI00109D944E|nr:lytic transglycosylase domain-containing protein [Sphingomonas flavalba]